MKNVLNMIKKRTDLKILLVVIIFLLIFLFSTSFGFVEVNTSVTKSANVSVNVCGALTFKDEEVINRLVTYPMSDNRGLNTEPYSFSIKNTCENTTEFIIYFVTFEDSTINNEYVNFVLNDGDINRLTTLNISSLSGAIKDELEQKTNRKVANVYELESGILNYDESLDYNLKLWLDDETPNSEQNKAFTASIAVAERK